MTRVLHCWDQAGIACIIAKWQRKLGHEVQVIKPERNDQFGFLSHYNETKVDFGGSDFDDFAVDQAYKYDIIHCHSVVEIASTIKTIYPEKKVFIHYHGSDLRTNPINTYANSLVDGIFYATPDLKPYLPSRSVYISTAVDTDMFYHTIIGKDPFINTDIKNILYKDTPELYRKYGVFIDKKIVCGKPIPSISKIGWECMALGLKVITFDNRILDQRKLPYTHTPEYVTNLLEKSYLNTINKK